MTKKIRGIDIAKALKVSPSAVSCALNNRNEISSVLKDRIIDYAIKTGYFEGRKSLSSPYIAEVCGLVENTFPLHAGITGILKKRGYSELRYTMYSEEFNEDPRKQVIFERILQEEGVKGIIVIFLVASEILLNRIAKKNIPIVLLNGSSNIGININVDDEHGGYIATKKLIELGHKKIGMILPDYYYDNVWNNRRAGYKRALLEAGIESSIDLVEPENTFTMEGSERATMSLIRRNPGMTGIVYVSDKQAMEGIRAMKKSGLKVPEDISVIGFDNSLSCEFCHPTLSSVEMHLEKMGNMAADYLLQAIERKKFYNETIVLKPELVIRESVRNIFS